MTFIPSKTPDISNSSNMTGISAPISTGNEADTQPDLKIDVSKDGRYNTNLPSVAAKTRKFSEPMLNPSNASDAEPPSPLTDHSVTPPFRQPGRVKRLSVIFNNSLLPPSVEGRSPVEGQSPNSLSSRRPSRRSSVIVPGGVGGAIKIEKYEKMETINAKIPEERVNALITRSKNKYQKGEIRKAIEAYETECHCSWKEMKHHWGNDSITTKNLRIINALREMDIEEGIEEVKMKFPGMEVINAGSKDPKSDCDLTFKFKEDPGKEIEAASFYRKSFAKKSYGASSAYIYDNNVYTKSYDKRLNNPDKQAELQNLQHTHSLVMFTNNAGLGQLKMLLVSAKAAGQAGKAEELEKQVVIVESMVFQQNTEFITAMLEEKGVIMGPELTTVKASVDYATQLRKDNPNLAVIVDAALEEKDKTAIQSTIASQIKLDANLKKMRQVENPSDYIRNYQETLKIISEFGTAQIKELEKEKTNLQREIGRIGEKDTKMAIPLRELSNTIFNHINRLKLQVEGLDLDSSLDSDYFSKIAVELGQSQAINEKLCELDNLPLNLHILNQQKAKLENTLKGLRDRIKITFTTSGEKPCLTRDKNGSWKELGAKGPSWPHISMIYSPEWGIVLFSPQCNCGLYVRHSVESRRGGFCLEPLSG